MQKDRAAASSSPIGEGAADQMELPGGTSSSQGDDDDMDLPGRSSANAFAMDDEEYLPALEDEKEYGSRGLDPKELTDTMGDEETEQLTKIQSVRLLMLSAKLKCSQQDSSLVTKALPRGAISRMPTHPFRNSKEIHGLHSSHTWSIFSLQH